MFGANKRLRELGKETSTMYNTSAYDSANNKKIYVINTKNNNSNQAIGVSNNASGIIIVVAFIFVGIFVFSFFAVIASTFSEFESEFEVVDTQESIVIPNIYDEEWANEFYYYLTHSYSTHGIKCDEIAFVDLDFDNNPELLIHSNGNGWADYIIEYSGDMKFNNIFVNDDLKILKLYQYQGSLKWGIVKNIGDAYAQDPMLDTYWMRDVLKNNKYEPDLMSTFKSLFDELYLTTNLEITFTEMVESEKDFQTAIDNYYYLNDSISIYKNN